MSREFKTETFLRDVSKHEMNIIRDEGVYRHIRFKRPNTSNMYFDIITWPGNLCYTGDMGTYVFSRVEDMMYFFAQGKKDEVVTNYYYWTQKLLADSIYGNGVSEYEPELFIKNITEEFEQWKFDYLEDYTDYDDNDNEIIPEEALEFVEEQWERVERKILSASHDGEHFAYDAAMYFDVEKDSNGRRGPNFDDFWEFKKKVKDKMKPTTSNGCNLKRKTCDF